jgi:hypothetical protein
MGIVALTERDYLYVVLFVLFGMIFGKERVKDPMWNSPIAE